MKPVQAFAEAQHMSAHVGRRGEKEEDFLGNGHALQQRSMEIPQGRHSRVVRLFRGTSRGIQARRQITNKPPGHTASWIDHIISSLPS